MFQIAGLETNIRFLLNLVKDEEFGLGNVHTNYIKDHFTTLFKEDYPTENELMQAALAIVLTDEFELIKDAISKRDQFNPFVVESGFRVNHQLVRDLKLIYDSNSK